MSGYALAPGISYCDAGGRYIFLDLKSDRYFCLRSSAERAFERLVAGTQLGSADRNQLSMFERQGLLRAARQPGLASASTCWSRPARSLVENTISVSASKVAIAATALLQARWSLRLHSLNHLVSRVRARKSEITRSCEVRSTDQLVMVASAFRRAALLTGSLNQCLASSLAICNGAFAQGIAVDLVLGVKLRPFHAHAWVQTGDILISDPLDRVAPFKPVLVV